MFIKFKAFIVSKLFLNILAIPYNCELRIGIKNFVCFAEMFMKSIWLKSYIRAFHSNVFYRTEYVKTEVVIGLHSRLKIAFTRTEYFDWILRIHINYAEKWKYFGNSLVSISDQK